MDRIINDFVTLNAESKDLGTRGSKELNTRLIAVQNLYKWLHEQGILKEISFQYKEFSDQVYFAFDAKDAEPYRKRMEESGIKDADIAASFIFDQSFNPCLYCGAIELGWTMHTYRNNSGCIGRSWECWTCRGFHTNDLYEVVKIKKENGPKEAVNKLWSFIEWTDN